MAQMFFLTTLCRIIDVWPDYLHASAFKVERSSVTADRTSALQALCTTIAPFEVVFDPRLKANKSKKRILFHTHTLPTSGSGFKQLVKAARDILKPKPAEDGDLHITLCKYRGDLPARLKEIAEKNAPEGILVKFSKLAIVSPGREREDPVYFDLSGAISAPEASPLDHVGSLLQALPEVPMKVPEDSGGASAGSVSGRRSGDMQHAAASVLVDGRANEPDAGEWSRVNASGHRRQQPGKVHHPAKQRGSTPAGSWRQQHSAPRSVVGAPHETASASVPSPALTATDLRLPTKDPASD